MDIIKNIKVNLILSLLILVFLFPFWKASADEPIITPDKPIQFLPIINGGNSIRTFYRYVTWLTGFDFDFWCADEYECIRTDNLNSFEFISPIGYIISAVRLYTYDLAPGGSSIVFVFPGCFGQICVFPIGDNTWDSWKNKDMKAVRITDGLNPGWTGEINFADFCIEIEGFDYQNLCDRSWNTKELVFYAEEK